MDHNAKNKITIKPLEEQYKLLIVELTEMIHKSPKYIDAYYDRAEINKRLYKYDAALEDYFMLNKLKPNDDNILFWIGYCLVKLNRFEEAKEFVVKSLSIKETSLAYEVLGTAYLHCNKIEDSLKWLNKAVDMPDHTACTLCNRAQVHMSMGNYENAKEDINNGIIKNKDESNCYYMRGLLNKQLKNYTDAMNDFGVAYSKSTDLEAKNGYKEEIENIKIILKETSS